MDSAVTSVDRIEGFALIGVLLAALVWTGSHAVSLGTWTLEVVWVLLGLPLVLLLSKRFPLTRLACWLLLGHALVLCYGGEHTYAETPLGNAVRDLLGTQRNDYDRFAHVIQGFVPAVAVREILVRRTHCGRAAG